MVVHLRKNFKSLTFLGSLSLNLFSFIKIIAIVELKNLVRSLGYWLTFVALIVILFSCYFNISTKFSVNYTISPSSGLVNAEYTIPSLVLQVFLLFSIISISILMAYMNGRLTRDYIAEVIDSQPITNFQLLLGRAFGVTTAVFLQFLVCFGLLCVVGIFLDIAELGAWGGGINVLYLIRLAILDVVPALIVWAAISTFLFVYFRSRVIVVVLISALSATGYWFCQQLPMSFGPYLGMVGMHSLSLPSDILPNSIDAEIVLQRIGGISLGLALIFVSGVALKRFQTQPKPLTVMVCSIVVALGTFNVVWPPALEILENQQQEKWRDIHEEQYAQSTGDLLAVGGQVAIEPGERLSMNLTMHVQVHELGDSERVLLSFNPGMSIDLLTVNGRNEPYEFKDGLLAIQLSKKLRTEETLLIRLHAHGLPDIRFAYLDESIDLQHDWNSTSYFTRGLGTDASLYDTRYVALLPAIKWLPTLGVSVHEEILEDKALDFFDVDLTVSVPSNWTIASVHKELIQSGRHQNRFKVSPQVPVASVTLIASEFVELGWDLSGVNAEVLLHRRHAQRLVYLAEHAPAIRDTLEEMFKELENNGFSYPLSVLSLVEVPSSLRTYGGGWEMGSVIAAPGLLMLREWSLPGIKLNQVLERYNFDIGDSRRHQWAVRLLNTFFTRDQYGGDVIREGARNLLDHWSQATGPGASAIDCIVNELAHGVMPGRQFTLAYSRPHFSAVYHAKSKVRGFVEDRLFSPSRYRLIDDNVDLMNLLFEGSNAGWHELQEALTKLDFRNDSERSRRIVTMKCKTVASSLLDAVGPDTISNFLSTLRTRFSGSSFSLSDIAQISRELEIPELSYLIDWIEKPGLPGFLINAVAVDRVVDLEGLDSYETTLLVRNDQNISGVISIHLARGESGFHLFPNANPPKTYIVPANTTLRIRKTSSYRPTAARINTFVSLNQGRVIVLLPNSDESQQLGIAGNEIEIVNEAWEVDKAIVVDDLDRNFTIDAYSTHNEESQFDFSRRQKARDTDVGLPIYIENDPLPPTWSRVRLEGAHGKYRRTAAIGISRRKEVITTFKCSLPESGSWQLDFHMPVNPRVVQLVNQGSHSWLTSERLSRTMHSQATYNIWVVQSGQTKKIEFNAMNGTLGWNRLGAFELGDSDVEVQVSNRSDGLIVYADAIRWTKIQNEN